MNKLFLIAKLSIFSLLFFSLTGFDWVDDINKTVSTALISNEGGIPAGDVSSISKSMLSIREKSLNAPADKMPFTRLDEESVVKEEFLPALEGEGKGLSNPSATAMVALSLNKENYQSGNVLVTIDGKEETMRIAAAQLFGDPDDASFEYLYLLSGSDNSVAYLAVISNEYELNNEKTRGFEGALLYPGLEKWDDWKAVYTVDFGYGFPVQPQYRGKIDTAKNKVSELRRSLSELKTIKRKIGSFASKAEKQVGTPAGEEAKNSGAELERELQGRLPVVEKNLLDFYQDYNQILEEYHAFTKSNLYTWFSPEIQNKKYSIVRDLKQVNTSMETIYEGLVAMSSDITEIQRTRNDSLARFEALRHQ